MAYLGKACFVVLAVVSAVGTSGCDDSRPLQETAVQPARTSTAQDKELLKEIQQYEFESLEQINLKGFETGDPAIVRILSRNNSLWIRLYEASKDPDAVFGIKSTGFTDEGDPVTTYYLAVEGRVRIITDSRYDAFAGGVNALTVKTPKPFYIGYAGVDLPCPCGSGKTWLDCNPGQCRTATLVIVTDNFPKDKQLQWIRPPHPTETSTTWLYASKRSAREMGPPGTSSGASILTVITPSGPKQVPGGETFPEVFGHPIQLNDLHAIILGKGVPKGVNPKALFGEPLLYAALTLVGGAADPSSVPVVVTLLASPNKKVRGWAREALGAMGEQDAALRVPVAKAVSTVLRPRNQDVGQMPEWLIAACRQPLILYQDASGKVHVGGETYDMDSVRQVLTEHIGKTKDDYVVLDRSLQTPHNLWLALEQLVEQLEVEPLGWKSVALAESVWNALETEPSPAEWKRTADSEPPPPDARVVALYEAGKVGEARYALVGIVGISYDGVTRRTAHISLFRQTADLEEALRHAHVVRFVRRCLAREQKMKTGELARAIETNRSTIVSVAAQARETMQKVLDLVEWLKAEKPSAITPLMRERVESARRELTLLVAEEITALRDFGRFQQAKELEERYGSPKDTASPEAAMEVLRQYQTAIANLNMRQLEALFLPNDGTSEAKNRERYLADMRMAFVGAADGDKRTSLVFEKVKQRPAKDGFLISAEIKDPADKEKPPQRVEIHVVRTEEGWRIRNIIQVAADE